MRDPVDDRLRNLQRRFGAIRRRHDKPGLRRALSLVRSIGEFAIPILVMIALGIAIYMHANGV